MNYKIQAFDENQDSAESTEYLIKDISKYILLQLYKIDKDRNHIFLGFFDSMEKAFLEIDEIHRNL